jgi:predicted DNA-binding WGR domain protein
MALAHLYRIDPETNMARFYCIDVAVTLFGDVSVLRTWGRIGTHGRASIETCASFEEAERAVSRTLRKKTQRGYRVARFNGSVGSLGSTQGLHAAAGLEAQMISADLGLQLETVVGILVEAGCYNSKS